MFSLQHAIAEAGLQLDDRRNLGENILLANYQYNNRIVARYLFLQGKSSSWYAAATDLQLEQQIQQLYFFQRNDVSWNLYLVVVMDPEEYVHISPYEKLEFLGNTEFTRKMIVPSDRFSDMIPAGHIIKQKTEEDPLLPIQDWTNTLEEFGLSGAWLEKPTETLITHFLETGSDQFEKRAAVRAVETQSQVIQKIERITIPKEFRAHCYEEPIQMEFPQVSLFCGPNGAGKTSILEAIELAMTGEVWPSWSGSGEVNPPVCLTVETENSQVSVSSKFDRPERKRRELEWYSSRPDAWERSQLPQLFHTYNHFSVEDVYRYGLGNDQPEYSKRFSQMLFGNEALHAQQHWQEYLKLADRKEREYTQQLQMLYTERDRLDNQSTTQFTALVNYLEHSSFQFALEDSSLPDKVLKAVTEIRPYYDQLSGTGGPLPPEQIPTFLEQLKGDQENTQKMLQAKLRDITEQEQQVSAAYDRAQTLMKQRQLIEQKLEQLSNLPLPLELLSFLAQHPDFKSLYRRAQDRFIAAEQKRYQYQAFSKEFHDLKTCTETEEQLLQAEKEYPSLKEKRSMLQQRLEVQGQTIHQKQVEIDALQNTVSIIQSAGRKFLDLQPNSDQCPLCGSQVGRTQMLRHLSAVSNIQSGELSNLMYLQQSTQAEYNQVKEQLEAAEKRINLLGRFRDAWQRIRSTELDTLLQAQDRNTSLRCVQTLLQLEPQIQQYLDREQSELPQLWERLSGYNKQLGTMQTFLSDVENACQYTKQTIESLDVQVADNTPSNLYVAIITAQNQGRVLFDQICRQSGNANQELNHRKGHLLQLQDETKRLKEKADALQIQFHQVELLNELWDHAAPYLTSQVCSRGTLDWGKQLPHLFQLASECIEAGHLNAARERLMQQIVELQKKQQNVFRLQKVLKTLQPLETYAEKFIQNHLEQISNIFLQLHTPQEYTRLELKTENQHEALFAVRAGDSQETVSLQEMSTGQRTSVVLSVLLEMHLSMQNVPRFLLIDEPVANIDDLNILSMLDFFREMVISQHRQLFVTTANQNVAKLFRRKFSFLETGYSEFTIRRSKDMKIDIVKKQYDQDGLLPD